MGQKKEDAQQGGAYAPEVVGTTQHTPGPFTAEPRGKMGFLITSKTGVEIADVQNLRTEDGGYAACEANALLFQAAPDLLAALEDMTALAEAYRQDRRQGGSQIELNRITAARAAIAKARGQS